MINSEILQQLYHKWQKLLDCNEDNVENILDRKFQEQPKYRVIVSDLTYVRVGKHLNYICVLMRLRLLKQSIKP